MNGGGGFANAPVTKGLLFGCVSTSVLSQAARVSSRWHVPRGLQIPVQVLEFKSPGALLFGAFLLYYFRLVERQVGTAKFGAFAFTVTGISCVLQYAASFLLPSSAKGLASSGPYGLVFACFVHFFFSVPASSKFVLLGWRLSDKAFIYLAGLQLLLSGGAASLVAGTSGVIAGLLYKVNFLGIKRFRFPAAINNFFSATLGQLLQEPAARQAAAPGRRAGGSAATAGAARAALQPRHIAATHQHGGVAGATGPLLPGPSQEALDQLVAMGFDRAPAARALQMTDNDVNAAIALLLA